MKSFRIYILLVTVLLTGLSCTKVIDLDLGNVSGLLVIEGNITDQPGQQFIKLSQNVAFTSTNTYPPVTGATVTVTDSVGDNFVFIEGPAGTYVNKRLHGRTGFAYTMHVSTGGKDYVATSRMPDNVVLDSISAENSLFNKSKNRKQILVHYDDPFRESNYYKFLLYVNNVQVKSIFAYNDQFINGRYVNLSLPQNDIDIYSGDTVRVEMQTIDKPIYTYWSTLMQQQQNGPGGGVTPSNPPTNITPAALGYFSLHTTQSKTIVIK